MYHFFGQVETENKTSHTEESSVQEKVPHMSTLWKLANLEYLMCNRSTALSDSMRAQAHPHKPSISGQKDTQQI
jgi:hypothetical protein